MARLNRQLSWASNSLTDPPAARGGFFRGAARPAPIGRSTFGLAPPTVKSQASIFNFHED
jgi:hypothetical protein